MSENTAQPLTRRQMRAIERAQEAAAAAARAREAAGSGSASSYGASRGVSSSSAPAHSGQVTEPEETMVAQIPSDADVTAGVEADADVTSGAETDAVPLADEEDAGEEEPPSLLTEVITDESLDASEAPEQIPWKPVNPTPTRRSLRNRLR